MKRFAFNWKVVGKVSKISVEFKTLVHQDSFYIERGIGNKGIDF